MILNALYHLYDRLARDPEGYAIPKMGFSYQKISFVVVLEQDGTLVNIEDYRSHAGRRPVPRLVQVPGQAKKTGSGLDPCFLWDKTGYLLGHDLKKPERAKKEFEAFRTRHLGLEKEISCEAFSAVCNFLRAWTPDMCKQQPILEEVSGGFGVFRLRGETRFVHDYPEISSWWEAHSASRDPGPVGQCLVTGLEAPIARIHPKIKGVKGAQSSGASMVSFNETAYESYGLRQSFNAPVSEEAALKYVAALNALLDGPRRELHSLSLGDVTVAFWTEKPTIAENIFVRFLQKGSEVTTEEIQDEGLRVRLEAFLRSLREGRDASDSFPAEEVTIVYYILGLAPSAARISVRFFYRGNLGELAHNLQKHYQDIRCIREFGGNAKYPDPELPPLQLLLDQTARERKDIPPLLASPLLRAVVTGGQYPQGLFNAVMRRIMLERKVSYARACVVKGYLVRNLRKEVPMALDKQRKDPAYRLGRLFAALEKTQQDAHQGAINRTIRDSFYSSASASPSSVFPWLLRTYQHHLSKLEGGLRVGRERLVQEVLAPITVFPAHLDLAEQGLFALGYYHQMNDFFTPKEETS